jgi:(Z)-2-((N-methylformamido)methylene)-5-hydroxybutyrolactone dehydrogenase
MPREYPHLFIGGKWLPAHGEGVIEMPDPATGGVFATVPAGDAHDVDAAVAAARSALDGPWSRLTSSQRGAMVGALASRLGAAAPELALVESADTGRPLRDVRGEVARTADWLQFFAGMADKVVGRSMEVTGEMSAYTIPQPIGVVAGIIPSNSPLNLTCWKLGPALAAGNTVILKPSEVAGVSLLELAHLVEEVGFPPGVVNVITGAGPLIGPALTAHPGIDKISFTGSVGAAQAIMAGAASSLKRLTLECGGKSPNIVFDDADLESALNMAVFAAFKSSGQSCSLGSRLLLQNGIREEFTAELLRRTALVKVGSPLDLASDIGPQASATQLAKTNRYIALGKSSASLAYGGGTPPDLSGGFYVEPTVFTDVDPSSPIAQEEIFGPVLAVLGFATEDEARRLANSTQYGLTAAVWTRDLGRAHRMARGVEAGLVTLNCYRPVSWMLPYGGMKLSGLGRENGVDAIYDYTENKTVVIHHGADPLADPYDLASR